MVYRFLIRIVFLHIIFLFLLRGYSFSQTKPIRIGDEYNGLKWEQMIKKLEAEYSIRIFYETDSFPDLRINHSGPKLDILNYLEKQCLPGGYFVSSDHQENYFVMKNYRIQKYLSDDFFPSLRDSNESLARDYYKEGKEKETQYLSTQDEYITKTIIVGSKREGYGVSRPSVWGYVKNSDDSSPVVQATLLIEETQRATATDEEGYYRLRLKKGKYTLKVSSLGRHEKKYRLIVHSDGRFDIKLDPRIYMLDEAVISSNRYHNVRGTQMGFEKLTTRGVKEVPMVLGEKDI